MAKKAAKAEVKRLKKEPKLQDTTAAPTTPSPGRTDTGLTPAERSASSAERQVHLQQRRVLLSAFAVLIALAMLLWTMKPWSRPAQPADEQVEATTSQPGS